MKTNQALFKNKNFIYFFFASLIGVVGEGIYGLAAIVLVLDSTDSIVEIAKMLILTLVPSVLLAPFVGVLIDKFDKRKIALACNSLRFIAIGIIPLSVYIGNFQVIVFYVSIFISYIIWFILEPAKESILKEILSPEHYGQGISLVQGAWQIGLLSSAMIAGVVMEYFGNGETIFISCLTYLIAGFLFSAIKRNKHVHSITFKSSKKNQYVEEMRDGWKYICNDTKTLYCVLTTSMVLPFIYAINTLIAPFNYNELNGDSLTLGFIDSGAGIGSLISAIICIWLGRKQNYSLIITISLILLGISTFLFSITKDIYLAFLMYLSIGIFIGNTKVLSRLVLYKRVSDPFIGRVMTAVTFLSLIFSIIISLVVAFVAERSIFTAYLVISGFLLLPLTFIRLGLQTDHSMMKNLHKEPFKL
jgi:MFS family permease